MLELILAITTGLVIGVIAGLVPGLHPNTLLPITLLLFSSLNPLSFAMLLIAMIITANYFEFIKTTYLSCPDEGTSLSIRYAQKLLLDGRGAEAVKLLSIGALGTTLVIIIIAPLLLELIPVAYELIEDYVVIVLIGLSLHLILSEGANMGKAATIYTLSGILGVMVLRTELINQPLLPLLTGLYGVSNILHNMQLGENVPAQLKKVVTEVSNKTKIKGIIKAVTSSSIITFVPAIGPSQAASISNELVKTRNEKEKLITLGGVNTGDVIFSLTALFTINKARSGVIEQISRDALTKNNYLMLLLASMIIAGISYWLVNKVTHAVGKRINKINYKKMNIGLLGFITIIVIVINGWQGLIVLITATMIGLLAISYQVNQNHLMAALIVPTIIYYL
ncbi:hypothetical protein GF352_03445 [archaeon]|nr:hypothetical protein [archaeon]